MNILFICDTDITSIAGGMERVVYNLSRELLSRIYHSYEAFFSSSPIGERAYFSDYLHIDNNNILNSLEPFIAKHNISIIITALASKRNFIPLMPILKGNANRLQVKIVYGYYNMPGYELTASIPWHLAIWRFKNQHNYKETLQLLFFTIAKKIIGTKTFAKQISRKLKVGALAHTVYVLAEKYKDSYQKIIDYNPQPSFVAIGNPLSYPNNIEIDTIENKEKVVINISRFDLVNKKQDKLIDIWSEIEKNSLLDDWKLILVGYGPDELYLKKYAVKKNVKRVEFVGACDPKALLKTSAFEGLPMVLLDAQQNGVVPISVDSFEAVYDIIEDGVNGHIVSYDSNQAFVAQLTSLMLNKEKREAMAKNGLTSCLKFEKEVIINKWLTLFNELQGK